MEILHLRPFCIYTWVSCRPEYLRFNRQFWRSGSCGDGGFCLGVEFGKHPITNADDAALSVHEGMMCSSKCEDLAPAGMANQILKRDPCPRKLRDSCLDLDQIIVYSALPKLDPAGDHGQVD